MFHLSITKALPRPCTFLQNILYKSLPGPEPAFKGEDSGEKTLGKELKSQVVMTLNKII